MAYSAANVACEEVVLFPGASSGATNVPPERDASEAFFLKLWLSTRSTLGKCSVRTGISYHEFEMPIEFPKD
jgi:hypothetical protein